MYPHFSLAATACTSFFSLIRFCFRSIEYRYHGSCHFLHCFFSKTISFSHSKIYCIIVCQLIWFDWRYSGGKISASVHTKPSGRFISLWFALLSLALCITFQRRQNSYTIHKWLSLWISSITVLAQLAINGQTKNVDTFR